jgi:NAD(P)H-hydrate epimerase
MEEEDVKALLPRRDHFSNKGTYGTVVLIGGSLPYSGAIRLAATANAAMRSGAGIARIAAPRSLCPVVASSILESTLCPMEDREGSMLFSEESLARAVSGTRVAAFGMGAGDTEETRKMVDWLLQNYEGILILDADGLNALAAIGPDRLQSAVCRVVLTPHPGEFARLNCCTVRDVLENPVAMAEDFARKQGAIILLKGSATLITDGENTRLTDRGCPGMATAGSGDVLSGILAALCAWLPSNLLQATAAAAWINGRAGELAQEKSSDISMTAGDTARALPEVFRLLRSRGKLLQRI